MNKWQSDVLAAIEHLRKFANWTMPAEVRRYDRSSVTIGNESGDLFRVMRGGCTWLETAVAIDASMARSVRAKQHAMLLARTLADGWRAIILTLGNSTAVYANGKLVGRVGEAA